MRAFLIPVAFAAIIAATPAAFAAQTANGVIKTFDVKAQTVTLDNGTTYLLPKGFKDPGLKAGEKVNITWAMAGNKYMANDVQLSK